jgi:hypothetical protein
VKYRSCGGDDPVLGTKGGHFSNKSAAYQSATVSDPAAIHYCLLRCNKAIAAQGEFLENEG